MYTPRKHRTLEASKARTEPEANASADKYHLK